MNNRIPILPVILCGGSGTRLWPLSRTGFPKQFLCLGGDSSLFQQAAQRLANLDDPRFAVGPTCIVTNEEHRFLVAEQMREAKLELGIALLEPIGRNTAPALTLAALAAVEDGSDPVLVVTPADQTVTDSVSFTFAMHHAVERASKGEIVILGIRPDKPETGFGYIKAEELTGSFALTVSSFVEKPDFVTAQHYLDQGNYFWNAGIFVLKASVWLKALETFREDIASATKLSWINRITDTNPWTPFVRPGKTEFSDIPAESVDVSVLEKCSGSVFGIKMVPLDAGWSDLGAWDAVWNVLQKDALGNAHSGDVLTTNSCNNMVHASSRLVSLVGVNNLIVIETPDAVLVVDKACSQDVKVIVNELIERNRKEHIVHRKVHRPWGWYDTIDEGVRFKVKRIQVKPKASLSLQMHHHRAEHWIVVTGTAEVTNGEKILTLTENQSAYIPMGVLHRLANPGPDMLEIIEVQSGNYLEEDDIVRYEDKYGRAQ